MRMKSFVHSVKQKGIEINIGGRVWKYGKKQAIRRQIPETTARGDNNPFGILGDYTVGQRNFQIYEALREIPIMNRGIELFKDLIGDWNPITTNKKEEKAILDFKKNINVGYKQKGYIQFRRQFVDAQLLYGTVFGELIPSTVYDEIVNLFVVSPKLMGFKKEKDNYVYAIQDGAVLRKIDKQDLIVYQVYNQKLNELYGDSIYFTLPLISQIITRILNAFDTRYWREGNPTYFFSVECDKDSPLTDIDVNKLSSDLADSIKTVMQLKRRGQAGDVHFPSWGGAKLVIRAIGVDGQTFNDEIPLKTVNEYAAAGFGVPLFMLSVHSEASAYKLTTHQAEGVAASVGQKRKLVETVDRYIFNKHLTLKRITPTYEMEWEKINLTDEKEKAQAEMMRANAKKLIAETALIIQNIGIQDIEAIADFLIEHNLIKLNKMYTKNDLRKEIKNFMILKESDKLNEFYKDLNNVA